MYEDHVRPRRDRHDTPDLPLVKLYLISLPQLVLGLGGIGWCTLLLVKISPAVIADVGGSQVYAPLLLAAAWSGFWVAAFALQNWRQAVWASLIVSSWFWLRLHQDSLFPAWFLVILVVLLVEGYLTRRRSQR